MTHEDAPPSDRADRRRRGALGSRRTPPGARTIGPYRDFSYRCSSRAATDAGITAGQAASVVDTAFDVIAGELAAGRDVAIAGFGKFSVTERAAREGRNRATGETIQIDASRAAKFSAAAALKAQLNS